MSVLSGNEPVVRSVQASGPFCGRRPGRTSLRRACKPMEKLL